jgi:hypothetical protein
MITTTILSTVLMSAVAASSAFCSATFAPHVSLARVLPQGNYVARDVTSEQPLSSLALENYGDVDQWTTLWNDNPWIINPDKVQGLLYVRAENLGQPEELAINLPSLDEEEDFTNNEQVNVFVANPTAVPNTPAPQATSGPRVLSDEQINFLGSCEAGMDPAKNTGNGYYGAFQFSYGTWKSMNTGYERADLAPIEVQKEAVQRLVQRSSIHTQFPGCASRMRNAGLI